MGKVAGPTSPLSIKKRRDSDESFFGGPTPFEFQSHLSNEPVRTPPPTAPLPPTPTEHPGSAGVASAPMMRSHAQGLHPRDGGTQVGRSSAETIRPNQAPIAALPPSLGLSTHIDQTGRANVSVTTNQGDAVLDITIALRPSFEELQLSGRRHPNFQERR